MKENIKDKCEKRHIKKETNNVKSSPMIEKFTIQCRKLTSIQMAVEHETPLAE